MRGIYRVACGLALSITLGACAAAPPVALTFPGAERTMAVAHVQGVHTYDVALATIDAQFREAFGLPPIDASIELLSGEHTFADALIGAGYEPRFAAESASRLRAVALHRRVIVNRSALSAEWVGRIGTLAHELIHVLQYELAGGRRGTSEQWLREGLAEWLSLQLLARLRAFDAATAKRWLVAELNASDRSAAPRFEEMMTFRQWVDLAGRRNVAPHAQSVLAVDVLIERHGLPAVIDYFRLFALREDPPRNFRQAFGQARDEFEREVDTRLGLRRD